ncbi:hypothetical protein BJ085DRAFT_37623 [Dimargaris cristalligena]|uniref:Integrator complex subunit 6-like beta-barrel domain-containing protein n=1 Tax=Dimargaris cristalligena TaxID=215637 RepID=A0A4Q0A262_9FUNG|nr:hypothetical protein BJ085DRAFT_37623 [Dimargaris cristalligena]|eukprot:RKP40193.1 hypothetical protein BJ085DRAFT_37623 [Dimargaris cristalligena]
MPDGLSHLDCAKSGIEYFIKKRNNQRDDKFMLLTYEEGPESIKARIRDPPPYLLDQVKNLRAYDMFNGGVALGTIFDQLNLYRNLQDMDTFGLGRRPWASEPALILWFTDGRTMIQPNGSSDKLNIPGLVSPGAERYLEPFRWDQRLFTIYLNAIPQLPAVEPQINAMCDVMGGASIHVSTLRSLQQSIDTMLGMAKPSKEMVNNTPFIAQPHGVLVNFECMTSDPKVPPNARNFHRLISLIGSNGRNTGFFPIPEAYWPGEQAAPPARKAHPSILYHPVNAPVNIPGGFPFDKYTVDPCPMTQDLLKQPPNTYWQVFVPNSYKTPGGGFPFGFLRANTIQTAVNLYILPYNYQALFILLDNLKKIPNQVPTPKWNKDFEEYLNHTPLYYIWFLRNALNLYGLAQISALQWSSESMRISKRLDMMRAALRVDAERLIGVARKLFIPISRVVKTEVDDALVLTTNAFDVVRGDLAVRLSKFRALFVEDYVQNGDDPAYHQYQQHQQFQTDEARHSVPIAMMGQFQSIMTRNVEQELRDPLADEEQLRQRKRSMFGNPYVRYDKRAPALDNVNEDMALDLNETQDETSPPTPLRGKPASRGGPIRRRFLNSALRKRKPSSQDVAGLGPPAHRAWPSAGGNIVSIGAITAPKNDVFSAVKAEPTDAKVESAFDTSRASSALDQALPPTPMPTPPLSVTPTPAPVTTNGLPSVPSPLGTLPVSDPKNSTDNVPQPPPRSPSLFMPNPQWPSTSSPTPTIASTDSTALLTLGSSDPPTTAGGSGDPGSPEGADSDILSSWKLAMSTAQQLDTPDSIDSTEAVQEVNGTASRGGLPAESSIGAGQQQHPLVMGGGSLPRPRSASPNMLGLGGALPALTTGPVLASVTATLPRPSAREGGSVARIMGRSTEAGPGPSTTTAGSSPILGTISPASILSTSSLWQGDMTPQAPPSLSGHRSSLLPPHSRNAADSSGNTSPRLKHLPQPTNGSSPVNGVGNGSPGSSPHLIRESFLEFKNKLLKQLKMDPRNYDESAVLQRLNTVEASPSFNLSQKMTLINSCVSIAKGLRRRAVVDKLERMRKTLV